MNAKPETFSGGEEMILTLFGQKSDRAGSLNTVNQLIIECGKSKESLEKLYNMFKDNIFSVAYSITQDYHLSEDCVDETFIRLAKVKNFSPEKGDGKGFIITIARNVALELRRRFKREAVSEVFQSYGESEEIIEDSIYVHQLLKHLNDKQSQTIVLKCCSGLTFKEIAKIMKCPESTVKSRYKKALSVLREKVGDNI